MLLTHFLAVGALGHRTNNDTTTATTTNNNNSFPAENAVKMA